MNFRMMMILKFLISFYSRLQLQIKGFHIKLKSQQLNYHLDYLDGFD